MEQTVFVSYWTDDGVVGIVRVCTLVARTRPLRFSSFSLALHPHHSARGDYILRGSWDGMVNRTPDQVRV